MLNLIHENILRFPLVFLIGYLSTYYFVPIARKFAQKFRIMDFPSKGRIHKKIVARTGGVAIFIGFQISFLCAVMLFSTQNTASRIDFNWWSKYFCASVLIFSLGLLDDRFDLRPAVKLLGQIAAAMLMFYFDVNVGKVFGVHLPMLLNLALTVLWFVSIINAFNLIDGLDGLAAGLALIGAVGISCALIFYNKPEDALILSGFIGACLAFLKFNYNPALIFLGDSGSMFLGFTLAAVSLTVSTKGATVASIGVPLLAVGIPLFDTALAVWRRSIKKMFRFFHHDKKNQSLKKSGLMERDLEHLHHRALRSGLNQRQAAWLLYCASSCLVLLGILTMMFSSHLVGIYLIAFILGVYVVFKHVARSEIIESGKLLLVGLQRENTKRIFKFLTPAFDFISLSAALCASIWLSRPDLTYSQIAELCSDNLFLWCGLPLVLEAIFGTYSRIWTRARLNNFIALLTILYAGILLSFSLGITFVDSQTLSYSLAVRLFLYMFFSSLLLVGLRSLPLIAQDAISFREDIHNKNKIGILLYGAGANAELFLVQRNLQALKSEANNRVIGLIDNEAELNNKFIRGYKVLGNIERIPTLAKLFNIEKIIVTKELSEEEQSRLQEIAFNSKISLTNWKVEEKTLVQNNGKVIFASDRFVIN